MNPAVSDQPTSNVLKCYGGSDIDECTPLLKTPDLVTSIPRSRESAQIDEEAASPITPVADKPTAQLTRNVGGVISILLLGK